MNRTIKFRAINTWFSDSKMVYFDLENAGDYIHMKENSKPNERWETMQFTGLLDKNGKEIYEGDIVEYDGSYGKEKSEVSFHQGMFIPLVSVEEGYNAINKYHSEWYDIIGNIYENPELLTNNE